MNKSHLARIMLAGASGVCVLVAFSALALAQARSAAVQCKKTETQAECHTRLKCKPGEELEDCQKRLLGCRAGEARDACEKRVDAQAPKDGNAGGGNGAADQGRDRDADDRSRDRDRDRDADDRGRDRDADDRGRDRRDRDSSGREHRARDDGGGRSRGQRGQRRGGRGKHSGYESDRTFGLGLELGEPTGLNGKYFLSGSGALDFGLGWIFSHYYYGDGFHLYGDYLWHPVSLASTSAFELPLYVGGGLRFWSFEYCVQRVCDFGGSAIGIRIPVGISFDFNNAPLDIFVQLVPVIDFISGDYYDRYGDRTHFGIDLSVGLRYWFK